MKRYWGGQKVEPGTYVNLAQLSFESVQDEESLPGTEMDEYRRVPTLALIVVGPLLGGLYVVFLPVVGFAMLAWTAGTKVVELAARGASASARVLKPAWAPSGAHLSRRKSSAKTAKSSDAWAKKTAKELEEEDEHPA